VLDGDGDGTATVDMGAYEYYYPSGGTLYVDVNAKGAATGLDWTDAYTNLQDALAVAESGDQVWVARGVYYPDLGAGQTDDDVDSTFNLNPGVAVYGGFDPAGGADTFNERDWEAYTTTLSGDIDNNDTNTDGNFIAEDWRALKGSNANHVVSSTGVTGTAIIDGFTITAGWAAGAFVPPGGPGCGGGMYNTFSSSPTLTNLTFSGNFANEGGGGMYNTFSSSPTLNDVAFHGNFSYGGGGGMYNKKSSNPTLTNVTFSVNYGDAAGGGMYNQDNSITLTDVTFSDNWALYYGGGMYNTNSTTTLNRVTFSSNSVDESGGGGMYNRESNSTLTDVTFSGNMAWYFGGGMFNTSSSNSKLTNVTFSGNYAEWQGGGMINGSSSTTLTNVIFTGNYAGYEGGGMVNLSGNPTMNNVIFSGNESHKGGGMYNWKSSPRLTNLTFVANWAWEYGSGMFNEDFSNPTLTNVILWGNTAEITRTNQISNSADSTPVISYSDVQGSGGSGAGWIPDFGTDGGGNIDADPLIRRDPDDGGDGWGDSPWTPEDEGANDDYGDLRLRLGSPAIDTGINSAIGLPTDLDGYPRIFDGNGDGTATVDMGAYEARFTLIFLPLVVFPNSSP
jgi:hypothetical protein